MKTKPATRNQYIHARTFIQAGKKDQIVSLVKQVKNQKGCIALGNALKKECLDRGLPLCEEKFEVIYNKCEAYRKQG